VLETFNVLINEILLKVDLELYQWHSKNGFSDHTFSTELHFDYFYYLVLTL